MDEPSSAIFTPPNEPAAPGQAGVAAVLPSYNESGRIGAVLAVLREIHSLAKIVVVDDGSSDETASVVAQAARLDPRICLVAHVVNLGKGQAIFSGWRAARPEYLLLLDADLIGLTPGHVCQLIEPVIAQSVEMTIGVFKGGQWNTDLSHWLTPWLSGQRCFAAALLQEVPPIWPGATPLKPS